MRRHVIKRLSYGYDYEKKQSMQSNELQKAYSKKMLRKELNLTILLPLRIVELIIKLASYFPSVTP